MRISYIINSLDGGGAAMPVADVIGVMRDAGHKVSVISLMERDGRARPLLDKAAIPYKVIGGPKRSFIATSMRLQKLLRDDRPDLLWTSLSHATILGGVLGALNGIPVVSWLHNAYLKPANQFIMRRTKGLSRSWVSDSAEVVDFGVKALGMKEGSISIWPLFIADDSAPVAKACGEQEIFRIGSLGRLHPNKGYDVLVRALALLKARNLPSFKAVIGGEGVEHDRLTGLAAELGVTSLELAGFQSNAKAFLASLHAYVQPSHHEGLCIAAHEAMQAGLPVIVSRVGEIQRSVTAAEGGSLVDYGDAEGLANAIEALVIDKQRAAETGAAARRWVLDHYGRCNFRDRGLAAMKRAGIA